MQKIGTAGRTRLRPLAAAIALATLAACTTDEATAPIQEPKPVAIVAIAAPRLTMVVGEQMTIVATPKAADGETLDRLVTWNSSDTQLATVNPDGTVFAMAPGPVTISASSGGQTGSVQIVLAQPEPPPVTEVILTAATSALEVGETIIVGVRLKLATGEDVERTVTWTSSAPLVATATVPEPGVGLVRARAAGVATITAAVGTAQASLTFRIAPRPAYDLLYAVSSGGRSEIHLLGLDELMLPVRLNAGTDAHDPSASPDGTQIVFSRAASTEAGNTQYDLFIVSRDGGSIRQLTRMPGMATEPRWSPDGARIVFRATNADLEDANLWVVNVDGTGLTNLTGGLGASVSNKRHPAWSPDGSRIAFIAARDGLHKVWTMNANGTNAAPLMSDVGFDQSPTWSPAGDRIAFARFDNVVTGNGWDVMIVPSNGGTPVRLSLSGDQLAPAWAPDGEYIAVAGTRFAGQGMQNLYTMRPDGTALRLRTMEPHWGGGNAPTWIVRR